MTSNNTIRTNALWAMQVVAELTDCAYAGEIPDRLGIAREELPAIACFIERVATASYISDETGETALFEHGADPPAPLPL